MVLEERQEKERSEEKLAKKNQGEKKQERK